MHAIFSWTQPKMAYVDCGLRVWFDDHFLVVCRNFNQPIQLQYSTIQLFKHDNFIWFLSYVSPITALLYFAIERACTSCSCTEINKLYTIHILGKSCWWGRSNLTSSVHVWFCLGRDSPLELELKFVPFFPKGLRDQKAESFWLLRNPSVSVRGEVLS